MQNTRRYLRNNFLRKPYRKNVYANTRTGAVRTAPVLVLLPIKTSELF
jgi:hypothetical protein